MALPESVGRTGPRPALRLVETKSLSREDWLSVRKNGIGGSDAAAAAGLSPYTSPIELWMIKVGLDANLPKPDANDTTEPVYWGTLLEPIVAASYTKQTGNRVRRVNAVLQHPTIPFMLANIDREVIGNRDVQLLECKTAGEFGARLWRDGVPEYVQLQVQHQLAVTGRQAADVAVLLCGQKLEVHRVMRDDGLIARLIELEAAFWRYVEAGTPPPADGSESADRALRCLYPARRRPPMAPSRRIAHCAACIRAPAARSISRATARSRPLLPIWSPCAPRSRVARPSNRS
jgi:putative phage-type endonuclease